MRGAALIALVVASACDRGHSADKTPVQRAPHAPSTPGPAASSAPPAAGGTCKLAPIPLRLPAPKRLVAIGDLHGDLHATRAALRLAGAIDDKDRWIGGDLMVVQTGDILDRGDDEQAILDLLFRLEGEAKAAGGAVVMLLGNHELMNAALDFRYVTPGGLRDFNDAPGVDPRAFVNLPEAARGRVAALAPGGVYARKLATHNVVAIIGDTVFSHAGVVAEWATHLDDANLTSRCWLDGQAGGPDAPPLALTAEDSPVWTRALGGEQVDCTAVKATLAALGAKRMVFGHTVQGTLNGVCDDTVWRIDVGLAKAYDGPIEVLELLPTPRILRGTR